MHFIATHDSCDFQASKTTNEEHNNNKKKNKVPIGKPHNGLSGESRTPFFSPAGSPNCHPGFPQPASLSTRSGVTQHSCILSGSHAS